MSSDQTLANLYTKPIVTIIDKVEDFPIGIEEAQEIRRKLIEQRST
jgi:hypothetical protein